MEILAQIQGNDEFVIAQLEDLIRLLKNLILSKEEIDKQDELILRIGILIRTVLNYH